MDKPKLKPIPNYNGLYSASTDGKIYSHVRSYCSGEGRKTVKKTGGRFLNPFKLKYLTVILCKDGVRNRQMVHRLVAKTFLPNPKGLKEVNHKDGNKHNNHVSNLEWITRSGNALHAYSLGISMGRRVVKTV